MGRIGRVIKSYIAKLSGSGTNAQFSSVEEFVDDQRTVQVFGPCNEDFAPPENCKTFNIPLGRGRGFLISAAYHNQKIAPVAVHGERRIYSTNQAGDTVMSEVFLKQDGTLDIKNANAQILMNPDGTMLIENGGVTITINQSGLLEIETTGNTEITSAKTIINNDVDIVGTLNASVSVISPTVAATTSLTIKSKEMDDHRHSQDVDSDEDIQQNTNGPV